LDLPKYESLDTQVLGVSVDVLGALQAFAEKLGLTYPLLSDFSRETVKKYGVMISDPNSAYYRMAQRSYFVIDKQGIIRYKHIMEDAGQMLDPEEIFNIVQKIATGAQ
jgi:glutaredoxin-dependent peroxiredoxin